MNEACPWRVLRNSFLLFLLVFTISAVALPSANGQTLNITNQPLSRSVIEGESVTLTVGVDSAAPLTYQWRRRGIAIPGATSSDFTLGPLAVADCGFYSVVVSDGANSAVSSNAVLRVALRPQQLVSFGDAWQYNQGGTNLTTAWRAATYDDSFWSSGVGLFGIEDSENPALTNLLQTPLVLTNKNNSKIPTYYFRKRIPGINASQAMSFLFTNFVDDGAVFYLNGVELFRYNLPAAPSVISFFTAASSPVEASPVVSSVPVNLPPSQDAVFAVELHNASAASLDAVFGSSITMTFRPPDPPLFTGQPLSRDALVGSSVSFTSMVSGSTLSLQWFKDGSLLAGETNAQITLAQCAYGDAGFYSLQASNVFTTVTSDPARLRVVSTDSVPLVLIALSDAWKLNYSGLNLGTAWKFPAYDDSNWPTGQGIFASFADYAEHVGTLLPLRRPTQEQITTYYFRRHFNCPVTNTQVTLITSNLIDDGAVFYINGAEASRLRIGPGAVAFDTLAADAPNNGHSFEIITLPSGNLVQGDNLLAVEVHQASATNSDVGFGLSVAILPTVAAPVAAYVPLTNATLKEFDPLLLRSAVYGSAPVDIQWFKDGAEVPGATDYNFSVAQAHGSDAGDYYFIATNLLGRITGNVAHVTVIVDRTSPAILDATARPRNSLVLRFSEPVDPSTATNLSNYVLTPSVLVSSIRMATSSSILLTLAADVPKNLQLSVSNVRDFAIPANVIAPNSAVLVTFDPAVLGHPFTAIQTVFLIVFENTSWSRIVGSTNAPYFNSILPMSSYASQFYSPPGLHGSLSRYIWMEAGTNFNVVDDRDPAYYHFNTLHFTSLLDQAGIPWKGYQEDISGNDCPMVGTSPYAVRHNPTMYFEDVTSSLEYCTNHMRPYAELAADLANNRIARFNYIKPNTTNDMHDNLPGIPALTVGDNWLAAELPKIFNSAAFTNNGLVLLTWDEDDIGGLDDPIGMIALSPLAKGGGYNNSNYYNHSAILRTFEEIFGVRPFLGEAVVSPDFADLFKLLAISSVVTSSAGETRLTYTNTIAGKINWLQASSNLVNWTTIATNVSTTNFLNVVDLPPTTPVTRFYRLLQEF